MDLSSPLSSLIPSMDGAALEVLVGTESSLGASRIHRLARRGSRQGIVNALERLVEHGLVQSEPTNFGHAYRFNRDHLLAAPVLQVASARQELFGRLSAECAELDPTPLAAVVFGSQARGDSTPSSDIDLLLLIDTQPEDVESWLEQLGELSLKVQSWTGNRLQTLTHDLDHVEDLVAANEPIIEGWREDGITILGSDIRTMLRSVEQRLEAS